MKPLIPKAKSPKPYPFVIGLIGPSMLNTLFRTVGEALAPASEMKTLVLWPLLLNFVALVLARAENSGLQGAVTLDGAPFPVVEVEASSAATNQFWETSTNSSGRYLFDQLPPGHYTAWAEAKGLGCIVTPGVIVKQGALSVQNFRFSKNKRYPSCESLKPKKRQSSHASS